MHAVDRFLRATPIVDWDHPAVSAQARALRGGLHDDIAVARRCFEWVRDEIKHSMDHRLDAVTCAASEVLEHGSGFCYAKSHLLAALLRANGLPAGFCYQRLRIDVSGERCSLHGFNAVHLAHLGWYRIDARGNRVDVDAQFTPPIERLAFTTTSRDEADLPEIWTDPLPIVVEALRGHTSAMSLVNDLPDITLVTSHE